MQLIDLLDQIDQAAPRCCQTCRHCGTHAACDGCLGGTQQGEPFPYRHWEPGNWLRELHAAEVRGIRTIVIGGQGEADFCATSPPDRVTKHLHDVAGECGYLCGRLTASGAEQQLSISTREGTYVICWRDGHLDRIVTDTGRACWRADDPGLREW